MSQVKSAMHSTATSRVPGTCSMSPLLIGDGIHVLDQQVHQSLITQDQEILGRIVRGQLDSGAQALAVNLGPGRQVGRLTPWVVDTIRELTDKPLFVSANILAQEQVLQEHGQGIAINAVTANPDELTRALAVAKKYGSSLVVLLVQSGRVPAGPDDRIQLASEVLQQAVSSGLPLTRLYLDPVLASRPDPSAWHVSRGVPDVGSAVEAVTLIHQLDSDVKTVVALGNGSEGMARERRSGLHGQMLSVLSAAGLDAVLLNCLDSTVMRIAEELQDSPPCCRADADLGQVCSAA